MTVQRRAFTLLELIAVMVMLAILTTLGATRLRGLRERGEIDQAALRLRDQALRARHLAQLHQRAVRLRIDLDAHDSLIDIIDLAGQATAAAQHLPDEGRWLEAQRRLDAVFVSATGERSTTGSVDLVFLPDRRCDGAGDLILRNERSFRRLRIPEGGALPTIASSAEGG